MQVLQQHKLEMDRYPVRAITGKGLTFTYRESGTASGDRPVILLLHGIGSGSGSWVRQIDELNSIGRVIAWDAPGYGGSTPLETAFPVAEDYARALSIFCGALSLPKIFLIAHSLGAIMAARFARKNPDGILGLVLAAPASGYGDQDKATRMAMIDERTSMMKELGPDGMANARAGKLLAKNSGSEKIDLVAQNMRMLTVQGYAQAVHLLAQGNIHDDLANYPRPINVICGSDDTVTPPEKVRDIAARAPNAKYQEIPGAAHACYIDEPSAFAALVKTAIEQRSGETT